MAEHFRHLLQMPSGISRLRDFEVPILGFLKELGDVPAFADDASALGIGRFFLEKIDVIRFKSEIYSVYNPRATVQTHT